MKKKLRPKIAPVERFRLHGILDSAIDKMDEEKNRKKPPHSKLSILTLSKMVAIEQKELDLAVYSGASQSIESECFDIINECLMIVDNVRGNV